ncbi:CRISPR-associated endonuclease Cas2 [Raineyella sp. W15-4]|uniref:CRISPR-associated endonuclease Cas2 n=1 Tax=Raineyella sp. W15-4 TaxID=3081651 RepID=UPI0029550D7A|nr:CRISPR-associated endonuclease Cas2 [Raineyella sp. W15-4]WOQ16528.1 CRISPR-associated endonuclease Cas2 [Raineyella sp. W15-4]
MTRQDAHRYVIAYDITDDRRRSALATLLQGYGDRVQFSVFVIDSPAAGMVRLSDAIRQVIDGVQDSVLICDLGPLRSLGPKTFGVIGRQRPITTGASFVI